MTPLIKGFMIAAVQVSLVASLGAKLLYDRSTRPRIWVRAAPYDPGLPIRGRYVRLQMIVEPGGVREPDKEAKWKPPPPVVLRVENDRLIAEAPPGQSSEYSSSDLHILFIDRRGEKFVVLDRPIAYFIPQDVPDPSIRSADE